MRVLAAGFGCGHVKLGLSALDKLLPRGVLRRSVILVAGGGGTGKSVLTALLASRFLERGEKVVYVTLDDDPVTLIESLSLKGFRVEEYLERGSFLIIDGYSSRYGIRAGVKVFDELASLDPGTLAATLRKAVERAGLECRGMLVIDSLNALLAKFDPSIVLDFVNNVRASIAKSRAVLTVITLHTVTQLLAELASSLEYMVDVVIWLRYHSEALEAGLPVRELLVKKAKGVPVEAGWLKFVITDKGLEEVELRRK